MPNEDANYLSQKDKVKSVIIMAAHLMAYDWQCPDIRLPAGPNTNRHYTGRHVEGSCCAKGYKAPEKVARNAECPCGSGRKYKHCKLKGLC